MVRNYLFQKVWNKVQNSKLEKNFVPLFVNDSIISFNYNSTGNSLSYFTIYSLQPTFPYMEIIQVLVIYIILILVVILRKKIVHIGKMIFKKLHKSFNKYEIFDNQINDRLNEKRE